MGKSTYRKSTIHQSETKDKGLSKFKRNIRESGTSIKTKNNSCHHLNQEIQYRL